LATVRDSKPSLLRGADPVELDRTFSWVALVVQIRGGLESTRCSGGFTCVVAAGCHLAADLSALLFVPLLWYWVGYRLDRRWCVADNTPWIALPVFTAGCLGGAFLPLGHAGFLPYGFMIWVITTFSVSRLTRTAHVVNELVISGDGRPCRGLKNSDYQFIGESEEHYRQLVSEKHRNPRNHVRMRRRILCQLH
jgi:hypothetical protein